MRVRKKQLKTHLDKRDVEICLRLKEAREALGLTQDACAGLIGIPKPRLANYELCRAALKAEVAFSFCNSLIVSEKWLATGEGAFRKVLGLRAHAYSVKVPVGCSFRRAYFDHLQERAERMDAEIGDNFFDYGWMLWKNEVTHRFGQTALELLYERWCQIVPADMRGIMLNAMINGGLDFLRELRQDGRLSEPPEKWGLIGTPLLDEAAKETIVDNKPAADYSSSTDMKTRWKDYQKKLKQLCAVRGTKAAIAKNLKVSRTMVSKWVDGSEPSYDLAVQIIEWIDKHRKAAPET